MDAAWASVLVFLMFAAGSVKGHGMLVDPPSRSMAGKAGFNVPINYNAMSQNCGGYGAMQSRLNGGRCGVCGDEYSGSRIHEPGPANRYASGVVVKAYRSGATVRITTAITASHQGFFEYRLCLNNRTQSGSDASARVEQSCFRHLKAPSGRWQFRGGENVGNVTHLVKLPEAECSACVLQWRWVTGNSWGCTGGQCGSGHGQQEEFWNCADISISSQSWLSQSMVVPRPPISTGGGQQQVPLPPGDVANKWQRWHHWQQQQKQQQQRQKNLPSTDPMFSDPNVRDGEEGGGERSGGGDRRRVREQEGREGEEIPPVIFSPEQWTPPLLPPSSPPSAQSPPSVQAPPSSLGTIGQRHPPHSPGTTEQGHSPHSPGTTGHGNSPHSPGTTGQSPPPHPPGTTVQSHPPHSPGTTVQSHPPHSPGTTGQSHPPHPPGITGQGHSPHSPGTTGQSHPPHSPTTFVATSPSGWHIPVAKKPNVAWGVPTVPAGPSPSAKVPNFPSNPGASDVVAGIFAVDMGLARDFPTNYMPAASIVPTLGEEVNHQLGVSGPGLADMRKPAIQWPLGPGGMQNRPTGRGAAGGIRSWATGGTHQGNQVRNSGNEVTNANNINNGISLTRNTVRNGAGGPGNGVHQVVNGAGSTPPSVWDRNQINGGGTSGNPGQHPSYGGSPIAGPNSPNNGGSPNNEGNPINGGNPNNGGYPKLRGNPRGYPNNVGAQPPRTPTVTPRNQPGLSPQNVPNLNPRGVPAAMPPNTRNLQPHRQCIGILQRFTNWCSLNCNHDESHCPYNKCWCRGGQARIVQVCTGTMGLWCTEKCNGVPSFCPSSVCNCHEKRLV